MPMVVVVALLSDLLLPFAACLTIQINNDMVLYNFALRIRKFSYISHSAKIHLVLVGSLAEGVALNPACYGVISTADQYNKRCFYVPRLFQQKFLKMRPFYSVYWARVKTGMGPLSSDPFVCPINMPIWVDLALPMSNAKCPYRFTMEPDPAQSHYPDTNVGKKAHFVTTTVKGATRNYGASADQRKGKRIHFRNRNGILYEFRNSQGFVQYTCVDCEKQTPKKYALVYVDQKGCFTREPEETVHVCNGHLESDVAESDIAAVQVVVHQGPSTRMGINANHTKKRCSWVRFHGLDRFSYPPQKIGSKVPLSTEGTEVQATAVLSAEHIINSRYILFRQTQLSTEISSKLATISQLDQLLQQQPDIAHLNLPGLLNFLKNNNSPNMTTAYPAAAISVPHNPGAVRAAVMRG